MPPPPRRCATPKIPTRGRHLTLEQLEDRTVLSTSTLHTALGDITFDTEGVSTSSILVAFGDQQHDYSNYSALAGTNVETKLELLPGYYIVHLSQDVSVAEAISAYANSGLVADVSPDYLLSTVATPNDPRYAEQWSLGSSTGANLRAPAAWNVTTGNTKTVVSVMDTGIDYNHQDLYNNIWINRGEIPTTRLSKLVDTDADGKITFYDLNDTRNQGVGKITDQNGDGKITADDILAPMKKDSSGKDNGLGGWADGLSNNGDRYKDDLVGWNFVADTNRPMDDNSHGTHVAGIIGAEGNNGVGVAGVSWVTQLMAIKFMDASGKGSIGSFIAGLDYAVAQGAKLSNNSWAGGTFTSLLYDALTNARAKGHIFVAAAGNAGTNIDLAPSYPASYDIDNVVVVASTSRSDTLSSFSNYGIGTVNVAAPGEGILSTLPGNKYGVMSGTSMAAPEVTGAMALIWAKNPTWTYKQVINQLLSTADKVSGLSSKVATGGRVNAAAAVGATQSTTTNPIPKVLSAAAAGAETNTLNKITVTFSEPVNPTTLTTSAVKWIGPSGKNITLTSIKAVSGSNNTKWTLNFLTQNTPGTYSLQLLNTIKDLQGASLANYYTTFNIAKTATYSSKVTTAIPDKATATSSINVNQNAKVSTITVKLNIGHKYTGDLAIYLVAPNGQKITLAYRVGGSGDNFTNTVFSDSGAKSITQAAAPFTGTFKPAQALSSLKNVSTLGTWKLLVQDLAAGDTGTLLNWSMTITTTNGQTLSTSSTSKSASIQGFVEEENETQQPLPPSVLTSTIMGPGLIGMQLVSPLGDAVQVVPSIDSPARTQQTSYNPGWLVRDLLGVQAREWVEEQPNVVQDEDEYVSAWLASDEVFQLPREIPRLNTTPTQTTRPADATDILAESLA